MCLPFGDRALSVFDQIDTDHDGALSAAEREAAMANPALQGEAGAATAMLFQNQRLGTLANEADCSTDISREDLQAYTAPACMGQDIFERHYYGPAVSAIENASQALYGGRDQQPSPDDVRQGALGDCWFLSALAGVAQNDPAAVRRMVRSNPDGTFTISFPGRDPVTVPAPTDAELATYASAANGQWVQVFERAAATAQGHTRQQPQQDMNGGLATDAIELLTGNDAEFTDTESQTAWRTHRQLVAAFADGRTVAADILDPDGVEGLPGGHSYTILNYDARRGIVTIRNPWGHTEHESSRDHSDGVFRLSVRNFHRIYDRVAVEHSGQQQRSE